MMELISVTIVRNEKNMDGNVRPEPNVKGLLNT
jgi:hypothetical protein